MLETNPISEKQPVSKDCWEEKFNPETGEVELCPKGSVPRYNPFTKKFKMVPKHWKLILDSQSNEWRFAPDR